MRAAEEIIIVLGARGKAFDPAALAVFASFTTPPTAARKTLINNLVVSLKNAGIWSALDIFYVMAAADSQAACINWKSPATFTMSQVGTPTFAADRGFTGDGAASHLDTGWVASTNGVNFTQNSASLWAWINTNAQGAANDFGRGTTASTQMVTRSLADLVQGRINDSDNTTMATVDCSGLNGVQRPSSTIKRFWQRGAQVGTDISIASAAPAAGNIWFLGSSSTNFSTKQQAAGAAGASLSGKEASFYSALLTYMQGVGAA